jgi:outer membrane immunogenic protein
MFEKEFRIQQKPVIICMAFIFASMSHNAFASSIANWQGYYIGGQIGKASSRSSWKYENANYFNTLGSTVVGNDFNLNTNGKYRGGYVGFNYQMDSFILGIEASALNTDLDASILSPFFPASDHYNSQLRWITTIKARLGYAYNQWLVSLTGGWARGSVAVTLNDVIANVRANKTQVANGWTVGPAIDYKFTNNFSVGLEYDYTKLKMNNQTISCASCVGSGAGFGVPLVDSVIKIQAVTARLSYYL